MNFIILLLSFLFGTFLAFLSVKLLALPLFYGVPKSIYYVVKGTLRPMSILFYIGSFIVWLIVFIVVIFISAKYLSSIIDSIYNPLAAGYFFGLVGVVIYATRSETRQDLDLDFWDRMRDYKIK